MLFIFKLEVIFFEIILCICFMFIIDFLIFENIYLVIFIEKKVVIWNIIVFLNLVYFF